MRRLLTFAALAVLLVISASSPARADITGFIAGSRLQTSVAEAATGDEKATRFTKGLAVGFGLIIIGFEFEWATTGSDDSGLCASQVDYRLNCVPSLTTGMGNVLLQTPHGLFPVQVYGTVGAGGYKERFDIPARQIDDSHFGFGTNLGGGVKFDLAGPLRVRLDYRVFKLSNDAFHKTPQRVYAGLTLAF